jgi:hypothetical protein
MSKKVIVKIDEITGYTNPQVIFLENWPDCVSKRCEITGNEVELVVQDGCTDICFDVMIRDDSDCSECPTVTKQVCLCDENTVLTGCQTCNDGVVKNICTDSELAGGKICSPNGCNCPAAKPFWNTLLEKCVVCEEGKTHATDLCMVCRNGQWEVKCDDCIKGDCGTSCEDTNAVWNSITKKCDCKPGYIDSPNGCIIKPDCQPGDTLPSCKECVDGEIVDIVCPDPNQICVNDECVDKPCEGDCKNGLDCAGENCGCDQATEKCVSCADNPTALGCDGNCSGGCSDESDCPNGCACVNGECVSCDNFPCSECGSHDGCGCTDGVNCEGDDGDCEDDLTIDKEDCGITGTLKKKGQCQCEVISSALTVEEARAGDVSGSGSVKYFAKFKIDIRKGIANSYAQHLNLPLFSNNIINNELPTAGSAVISITPIYRNAETNVVFNGVGNSYIESLVGKSEVIFKDTAEIELGETILTISKEGTTGDILIGYDVKATVKDLKFESECLYADTTIYESARRESLLAIGYKGHDKLKSSTSRNPLFTWTRGTEVFRKLYKKPESNGFFVDKLYGPQQFTGTGTGDGKSGEQVLSTPEGELLSLQDYRLEVDCGCDKLDVEEKIVICDIEFILDDHFRLEECNKKLLLDNMFDVCAINKNLNDFGWGNNHPSQTYYILKVNGVKVGKFIYDNDLDTLKESSTNIVWGDWEKTFTDEITSVSLEMNHEAGCKVDVPLSIKKPAPNIKLTCTVDGFVTANVPDTSDPSIKYVSIGTSSYYMTGKSITVKGLIKGTHTFIVTYKNGCTKTFTQDDNCCESATSITVQNPIPGVVGANKTWVNITLSGFTTLDTVSLDGRDIPLYVDGDPVLVGSGTHTIRVVDVNGCDKSETFTVEEITDNSTVEFDINPICINGTSKLIVTTTANTTFTVKTPNGNTISGVTNSTGVGNISGLSTGGEYLLETVDVNTVNVATELDVISALQLTSLNLSASNSYCTGKTIEVDVSGTAGANVTLVATGATGDTTIQLSAAGSATAQFTYASAGNYTIKATSIDLNGLCPAAVTIEVNVSIVDSPVIIDVSQECIAPISDTSDVKITVVAQTGLSLTAVEQSTLTNFVFLPTGAPHIYEATITAGSGKTVEITASNGTCVDIVLTTLDNCTCPFVIPPDTGTQSVYYLCNGNPAILSATAPIGTTLEWYSDEGLVNLISTGATATVNNASTYYVVSVNADGCKSDIVSLSVIDGDILLSVIADEDMCLDQSYVVIASVIGDITGLEYLFRVDGNVVQNYSVQSTYIYNASTLGTRTFEVTSRRYGDCETVADTTSDVAACCTEIDIQMEGATTTSCVNLTATPTGGTSPYTFTWTGTGDISGAIVPQITDTFDASVLSPGELIDLSLEVEDDNGCTETIIVSYNRCACLCDSNDICQTALDINSGGTNGAGLVFTSDTLITGKVINIKMFEYGVHDRYVVKFNGVTIVDTTYFGVFDDPASCYQTNALPFFNVAPGISSGSNTDANVDILAAGGTVGGGINVFQSSAGGTQAVLNFDYTIPSDGVITIIHNDVGICENQGQWKATVRCVN